MKTLSLVLDDDRSEFRPGDTLAGTASWQLDQRHDSLELRLFWFTRGKGTSDVTVMDQLTFTAPALAESRTFQFLLPLEPYSVSGRLISVVWAVELVADGAVQRIEFTVSPTGRSIVLAGGVPGGLSHAPAWLANASGPGSG